MDNPYRYIPSEDEFKKYHLKRARITIDWLKSFALEPPILEWSKRTPFTEMLEKEFGKIENISLDEPDDDYEYPKGHHYQTMFCFEVLNHMMNPFFVIKRIHGALATGGHLFVTCPDAPPFLFLRERRTFIDFKKREISNLLLRARYKFDIETKPCTEMIPYFGIKPLMRYYLVKRHFIHATPDWRKKDHWWE